MSDDDLPDDGPSIADEIRARIGAKPRINPPDWASWAFELDRLGGPSYAPGGVVDCWGDGARECFEKGMSPAEALELDIRGWD